MGTDDLFKKRKAKRLAERKAGEKELNTASFLIISEGEKTEPNYFNGLAKHICNSCGQQNIEVKTPIIDSRGEGKCTVSLVQAAAQVAARSHVLYKQIWILFDKDDFDDFDDAVELCDTYGYHAGWSNQSFEYWLLLHFDNLESALHRDVLFSKLNQVFKRNAICNQGYSKNDEQIFEHVVANGGLKNAVRNAKNVDKKYDESISPSKRDPCTKVYKLIDELSPWLQDIL